MADPEVRGWYGLQDAAQINDGTYGTWQGIQRTTVPMWPSTAIPMDQVYFLNRSPTTGRPWAQTVWFSSDYDNPDLVLPEGL